jgi:hypothetical protein
MSTIIRVLIVLVCAYAVRWSQALNFQTFPTLIKQRRNSDPKKPIFRFKKREHVADRAGRHVDAARRPLPPGHRTRRSASPPVDTVVHVPGFRIGALSRFKRTSYRGSHSLAGLIGLSGEMPGESFGLKPVSKL